MMAIRYLRGRWAQAWLFVIVTVLGMLSGNALGGIREERAAEAALTHRRIDLSQVRQWQRKQRSWRPFQRSKAKVLVINLWSKLCKPCLGELPRFEKIAEGARTRPEVQFAFIADPPDQTSEDEVVAFWQRPEISVPLDRPCPGGNRVANGDGTGCMLRVPDVDPARSGTSLVSQGIRPLTLLVDSHNVVRQVLAGSIDERAGDLEVSLNNLIATLKNEESGSPTR